MKMCQTIITLMLSALTGVAGAADAPLAAKTAPVATVQAIADKSTGMELIFVKGGCFQMGSTIGNKDDEQPVHEVCVSDFYLGKYEVTQAQWEKVMKNNPSHFKQCGPNCPVESVSWDDSQEFIQKLNSLSKKEYRLPTEAEWEYAARSGGKEEKFAGTSDEKSLVDIAWIGENSAGSTHQVGQKKANALGLYDMTGNVDEWCQDWYGETFYSFSLKMNPRNQTSGNEHVTRGGDWSFKTHRARVAHRSSFESGWRENQIGLRLVLPAN